MTAQLSFDIAPLIQPTPDPKTSIQQRWETWKTLNPWVLPAVEHLISEWFAAGHQRASTKQVWEVIRYQYGRTTGERFKANNDFTSRVARDLLVAHPEWVGRIEVRELRTP